MSEAKVAEVSHAIPPRMYWRLNYKPNLSKSLEEASDVQWLFSTLMCHLLSIRVAYANYHVVQKVFK